jgi:uridine kinase
MADEPRIETQDVSSGLVKPIFIGVTGGTASGKTSLCKRIGEALKEDIAVISLDSFYLGLS